MERREEPWEGNAQASAQANLQCEITRRICRALEVGEQMEVQTIGDGAQLLEGL